MIEGIGIVSQSRAIGLRDVARAANAIQTQVLQALYPAWGVGASVSAFFRLEDVPLGHWPVLVRDDLDVADAGVHRFEAGRVGLAGAEGTWSESVCATVLDLLVNPDGTRRIVGPSPMADQGDVEFVVAVAAGGRGAGPDVHGYPLSDILLPAYYRGGHGPYSTNRAVTEPRQLGPGGELTWWDGRSGDWWQQVHTADGPSVPLRLDLDVDGDLPRQLARFRATRPPPRLDIDLRTEPGTRPTGAAHRARRLNDAVNAMHHGSATDD